MDFYSKQILKTMSIVGILANIGGCAQDTMIRVNSTSALTLVPTTEIRYKACGDSSSGCQAVFDSIASEKAQIVAQARTKYQEYVTRQRLAAQQQWQNMQQQNYYRQSNCSTNRRSYRRSSMNVMPESLSSDRCQTTSYSTYQTPTIDMASSMYRAGEEPTFTPTAEDTKKIIKEVSSNSLNEYTFSKADGSIVVICPTRYCAIASGDGGWMGIGERGKSIESTSVVR
jgi:hypothetical protein